VAAARGGRARRRLPNRPADAACCDARAAADRRFPARAIHRPTRARSRDVQDLKKDRGRPQQGAVRPRRRTAVPANTQVAVFVSMDIGEFFALDSLTLKIDNKEVANYMYTPREAEALLKGGVHRVYLGNLKVGEHQLVAFFAGKGPNNLDYKRGANLKFEKGVGAKYLELKITDRQRKAQPEFAIKDWE
jgi:hypothetical protein